MSQHTFSHKAEAVITNLAYLVAGVGVWLYSGQLLAVAASLILLCFLSGIHHYFLTRFTRQLDYAGMYMVIFSIAAVFSGIDPIPATILSVLLGIGLAALIGSEPAFVGIGVVSGIVFIGISGGYGLAMQVMALMSVAYVFNHLGDNALKGDHSIIHGLGWHNVTAYALYIGSVGLA